MIVALATAGPLPRTAVIHFISSGAPDRVGSPWIGFGIIIGLSLFFIGLTVFLDELWARQESHKIFNGFALLDEIVVGAMVGVGLGDLDFLVAQAERFAFPWVSFGLVFGPAVAAAIALELLRPFRLYPQQVASKDVFTLKAQLREHIQTGAAFVYWEAQNPAYVTVLTILLPIVMFVGAGFNATQAPVVAAVLFVVGLLLFLFYGGQRITVTRERIVLRYGLFGIRLLNLRTDEIEQVTLHTFSALKDFGGYGIRFNREMKAYFLCGTRGVKVRMLSGKTYLLGSDQPGRLEAVIEAVTRKAKQETR
jgi:hypothetical protein